MSVLNEISELLQKGKAKDVSESVSAALGQGISAKDILNDGLIAGMMEIGKKFKENQIYVPEVLIAARAMNAGLAVLKPALTSEGVEPKGKAVICTVKGDLHDIGKNLVKMMLEGVGVECVDLGVDADGKKVADAVRESGAQLVCLSALLTTTMVNQKEIIDTLIAEGIRDKVKVMVGGAPVTEKYANEIGADAFTVDAASAAEVALKLLGQG